MQKTFNFRKITLTLLMLILGVAFLLPFLWMISSSFKPEVDVFKYPIEWIPKHWQAYENYREVWFGEHPFATYYWNTIKVSVLTTLLSLTVSSMAAYAFSHVDFRGRNIMFVIVLMTFMIPMHSIIVPQFMIFKWLRLFDSHLWAHPYRLIQCFRHVYAAAIFPGHS